MGARIKKKAKPTIIFSLDYEDNQQVRRIWLETKKMQEAGHTYCEYCSAELPSHDAACKIVKGVRIR